MDRYLVFARLEYEEPLTYQGELDVAAGADAAALARERFGEAWLELALIPETAIERVPQQAETEARA